MALDLSKYDDRLKSVDTVIVTGGGPSLEKYFDEIIVSLRENPNTALFDINGYVSYLNYDYLKDIDNLKYLFMQDLGLDINSKEMNDKRSLSFSTLPNARLVLRNDMNESRRAIEENGFSDEARKSVIWVGLTKTGEDDKVQCKGGTGAMVLSSIPDHVKEICIYGMDCVITGNLKRLEDSQIVKAYDRFKDSLMVLIAKLAETKFVSIHV
jgi:hypothetical protein